MTSGLLDIGRVLVETRVSQGMTQSELGRRVGVAQPQIARWEASDYATAGLSRVSEVADALGVTIEGQHLPIAAEQATAYTTSTKACVGDRTLRRLGVDRNAIAAFCRSHGIRRFELFGSVLTDEFRAASDIDVLVTYEIGRTPGLFDANDQETELSAMFRRPVDLVTRPSVEQGGNRIRRQGILDSAAVIYER